MTTFRELGCIFPLFEAPITDASDCVEAGSCAICDAQVSVRFELGIGCALMLPCPACATENGLDADDREDTPCRQCNALVSFPEVPEQLACCYPCLRAGKAAITKDTELGMVSWEQAFEGLTHGVPALAHPDFEMVPTDSDWVRARLTPEVMYELLRTPCYSTIQGDNWLFCCQKPMIFCGAWTRQRFTEHAPDGDGKALLARVLEHDVPGLWEDELHDETGIYVFRCGSCDRLRGHWDIA
jgi:uncharacterized protein CbrC (UPF0167 family)